MTEAAGSGLLDEVRGLLARAAAALPEPELTSALRRAADRLDEPLRVAIAGRVKAGKSTLLNAVVGEQVAATDAAECTRYVTTYSDGMVYRAFVIDTDGVEHQAPYNQATGAVAVAGHAPDRIDRLRVEFPSPSLAHLHLIDTPGLSSLTVGADDRSRRFLLPPGEGLEADAVIYLMRHLHTDDQGFLEAFADPDFLSSSAVNAIALVSRADEIGGGRPDALDIAGRIAARYEADPEVRRRASVVRPVAGLLGLSASTMTQDTYDAVDTLAGARSDVLDRALLGVDQLGEAPIHTPSPEARMRLVGQLGLFGVRLGVALVRHRLAPTASALAAALQSRSGLPEIRSLFFDLFAERRHVLRARSAVNLVEACLEATAAPAADVRRELDRIRTNAHELVELRLQEQLRLAAGGSSPGERRLDPERQAEIERLIGATGQAPHRRLGLPDDAEPTEVREAALAAHRRWRTIEASPVSPTPLAAAARVVVRSLERLLADLPGDETRGHAGGGR